jgi:serine/threonine protein kinase
MQPVPNQQMLCAAEMLEGIELPNGWKVLAKMPKSATGGCFSIPYFVERQDGRHKQTAFLKALNFRRILNEVDITKAMERHTRAFNFEKETLELCRDKKLSRIAILIDSGQYSPKNSAWPVAYIIFELAKGGDARKQLAALKKFDLAWTLRTLHQISVGLSQLHHGGIAHQDLKPSNILFFEAFGAKITDLGCADTSDKPSQSPRGKEPIPGDPNYAPPELFYGDISLLYERAMSSTNDPVLKTLASLYLSSEEAALGNKAAFAEFKKAFIAAQKLKTTNIPAIAEHMAPRIQHMAAQHGIQLDLIKENKPFRFEGDFLDFNKKKLITSK